ncbi:MAG TPA: DUF192 domain-containing protein [Thermomicrobiales bacterium]|nr:DUF192 domain-containing protein [Thermomicrobiales bacterium]
MADAMIAHGHCRVVNESRGSVVAEAAEVARTWWARGKGLLGRRALPEGAGLVIEPCSSIHTWFMAFPIDVAFVAADGRVVRTAHAVRPWRVGPIARGARYVVELPAGTLARTGTEVDDRLALEAQERAPDAP